MGVRLSLLPTGGSLTSVTLMFTGTVGLIPVSVVPRAACTVNPKLSPAGVFLSWAERNFNPALPSAAVMKVPLPMAVTPSFLNKVPLLIPVTLK